VTAEKDFVDEVIKPGVHSPEMEWMEAPEDEKFDEHPTRDEQGSRLYYHTWGTLDDVAKLRLQRYHLPENLEKGNNRVLGIQIEHLDGTVDTLGQWDLENSDIVAHTFYNSAQDGNLTSLDFTVSTVPASSLTCIAAVNANRGVDEGEPKMTKLYKSSQLPYAASTCTIHHGYVSTHFQRLSLVY